MNRILTVYLAVFSVVASLTSPVTGTESADGSSKYDVGKVAVLPLANYTETDLYYRPISDGIVGALTNLGVATYSPGDLRPVLREYRIRSRGSISQEGARQLKSKLDFSYVLIGSIDIVRDEGMPEIALSLRALDPDEAVIRASVSASASGRDYTGLFEVGTVENIDTLIELVTREMVEELMGALQAGSKSSPVRAGAGRLAVITFDNGSKDLFAGQVMTNWVISKLVAGGFEVVEPGVVDRLFLTRGGKAIGGLDRFRTGLMRDSLDVSYFITGEIDRFQTAQGVLEGSRPELAFGARLTDCSNGLVVSSYETAKDGSDFETILGMGSYRSLGRLAGRMLDGLQDWLNSSVTTFGVR